MFLLRYFTQMSFISHGRFLYTRNVYYQHQYIFRILSRFNLFKHRYASTLRPPTESGTSIIRGHRTYEEMIMKSKHRARCSLVIEDCSKKARLWHQPNDVILERLLISKQRSESKYSTKLYRWRVGHGDGRQRRFLLCEFSNLANLRAAASGTWQWYDVMSPNLSFARFIQFFSTSMK